MHLNYSNASIRPKRISGNDMFGLFEGIDDAK